MQGELFGNPLDLLQVYFI